MSDPFVAEIKMFAGNFAPSGFAFCDGQLLSIASNTALFSLVGTTFGGDGETTFGLPDLRGRTPIHPGTGPGLTNINLGQKSGAETHTLTEAQMAAHTHTTSGAKLRGTTQAGNSASPAGNVLASTTAASPYSASAANMDMGSSALGGTISADSAGSGQAFNLRDPYLTVNFIIALTGVFPSPS